MSPWVLALGFGRESALWRLHARAAMRNLDGVVCRLPNCSANRCACIPCMIESESFYDHEDYNETMKRWAFVVTPIKAL